MAGVGRDDESHCPLIHSALQSTVIFVSKVTKKQRCKLLSDIKRYKAVAELLKFPVASKQKNFFRMLSSVYSFPDFSRTPHLLNDFLPYPAQISR
ncbi:hypothetical protein ACH3XW_2505 [Acanthocheilonema viteae]